MVLERETSPCFVADPLLAVPSGDRSSSCTSSMFMVGEGLSRSSSRCVGLDLDRVDSPTGSTSSTVRSSLLLCTHARSIDQVGPSGRVCLVGVRVVLRSVTAGSLAKSCLLFRVAVGCCASGGACACACVVEGCRVRVEACAHGGGITAAWDLCEVQGDSSSENETWRMRGPPGVKRMSGVCPCLFFLPHLLYHQTPTRCVFCGLERAPMLQFFPYMWVSFHKLHKSTGFP